MGIEQQQQQQQHYRCTVASGNDIIHQGNQCMMLDDGQDDTSNGTLSQYEQELETLLYKYEPSKAIYAKQILDSYQGMEQELLQCYRHYYTGQGGFYVSTSSANNQTKQQKPSRVSFSLPKTAIGTYLKAKLRLRRAKSMSECKMEGIRGPEVPRQLPSQKALTNNQRSRSAFVLQEPSIQTVRSHHLPDHRDNNNVVEEEEEEEDTPPILEVKCLDTGNTVNLEAVNDQVLRFKSTLRHKKALSFRDKIIIFLQKHDISALNQVDELLNYGGRTNEETWEFLQAKYHVNQRTRLLRLFRMYEPSRVDQVDLVLKQFKGQEETYIAHLRAKYINKSPRNTRDHVKSTWKKGAANTYQLLPQ
jgi:hypothetical protein